MSLMGGAKETLETGASEKKDSKLDKIVFQHAAKGCGVPRLGEIFRPQALYKHVRSQLRTGSERES